MKDFKFNVSLNVLEHLGRGLYRNFITVIGEAISNSWDADAKNVWISVYNNDNYFIIEDDGVGMSEDDFRNKFLEIGYSKRKATDSNKTPKGRPYIGSKGIGKLALLSCSKTVSIISRKEGGQCISGVIDNSELNNAITKGATIEEYTLRDVRPGIIEEYKKKHKKGTIIYFDQFNNGIRNREKYLRGAIALYFRFSLLDKNFKIHFNDKEITLSDLQELINNTQFLWKMKGTDDSYVSKWKENIDNRKKETMKKYRELPYSKLKIEGFVASVEKPNDLSIWGTGEKVGIDLFVNGRLRETNILRHRSGYATRHVASYLYGQIHYNDLDDGMDRFTTSREGIKPEDKKFQELLKYVHEYLIQVSNDWDKWRDELRQSGDPGKNYTKEAKSKELYNIVSKDLVFSGNAMVDKWVKEIGEEAKFNYPSYAECFISENIIRKCIQKRIAERKLSLSREAEEEIARCKKREEENKGRGHISIDIRQSNNYLNEDLSYLSMDNLANLLDKQNSNVASLSMNAKVYKPFRDAIAHTALLAPNAKNRLNTVYEDIKNRIKNIVEEMANKE